MIDISKYFDESAIMKHVDFFAFNRQASTKGEKKSINYLQNELAKANINNKAELFKWADFNHYKPLLVLISLFIFIFDIFFLDHRRGFFYFIIIFPLLFLYFVFSEPFNVPFQKIGEKKESRNIVGEIPAKNKIFKRPLIIFSAHHESTSIKYSWDLKVLLKYLNILILPMYFFLATILAIFSITISRSLTESYIFLDFIDLIMGIILLVSSILNYINKEIDNSNDSVNTSSGVAILIELAKILRKEPLDNIDIIFLWSGGKRSSLIGTKSFIKKHFFEYYEEYELDDSYHVNIDLVGHSIGLVERTNFIKGVKINSELNNILKASAKTLKIKLEKTNLFTSANYNFQPFKLKAIKVNKNLQGSCFTIKRDFNKKNLDKSQERKIYQENMNKCLNICYSTLKSLDMRVA